MANGRSVVEEGLLEMSLTRRVAASPEVVFRAWTDAKQLAKWWGPKDFTNPVCELDARVGGSIRITMQGPDGMRYPTRGIFNEIIEPERIVFTNVKEGDDGDDQLEVLNTVIFSEENGKTKMT